MATAVKATRSSEKGLSLIEALVIVTVTALLALILLPLASRSAGRNYGIAERMLDTADAARAEAQVRSLAWAASDGVAWTPDAVVLEVSLNESVACAEAGGPSRVRLRIDADGVLWCEAARGRTALLRWREGAGRFSFSDDGRRWSSTWGENPPAFVRFEIEGPEAAFAWIAVLGGLAAKELGAGT